MTKKTLYIPALKCLMWTAQSQDSWEIYLADTLLHYHNHYSTQHMAEYVTIVLLQVWHQAWMIL